MATRKWTCAVCGAPAAPYESFCPQCIAQAQAAEPRRHADRIVEDEQQILPQAVRHEEFVLPAKAGEICEICGSPGHQADFDQLEDWREDGQMPAACRAYQARSVRATPAPVVKATVAHMEVTDGRGRVQEGRPTLTIWERYNHRRAYVNVGTYSVNYYDAERGWDVEPKSGGDTQKVLAAIGLTLHDAEAIGRGQMEWHG